MSWKTKAALGAVLILIAGDLAACGKVGRLERPGPLFGAGRIPTLMGDMAKGIKAFKKGMNDEVAESKDNKDAVKPT